MDAFLGQGNERCMPRVSPKELRNIAPATKNGIAISSQVGKIDAHPQQRDSLLAGCVAPNVVCLSCCM